MPTPKVSPRGQTPESKLESTKIGVDIGNSSCHVRFFAEHVTVTESPGKPESPLIPMIENASFISSSPKP